jgi:hypothetical protein
MLECCNFLFSISLYFYLLLSSERFLLAFEIRIYIFFVSFVGLIKINWHFLCMFEMVKYRLTIKQGRGEEKLRKRPGLIYDIFQLSFDPLVLVIELFSINSISYYNFFICRFWTKGEKE